MEYKVSNESFIPSLKLDGEPEAEYIVKSEEDKIIDFVKFNQAMEGFEMTSDSEVRCRKLIRGEISADDAVKEIIKIHGLESE